MTEEKKNRKDTTRLNFKVVFLEVFTFQRFSSWRGSRKELFGSNPVVDPYLVVLGCGYLHWPRLVAYAPFVSFLSS